MTAPNNGPAPEENPVVAWARAIVYGIRDTAEEMLEVGREAARKAYDEGWDRYDDKTKHRHHPRD